MTSYSVLPIGYFHCEKVIESSFGVYGECPLCQGGTVVGGHSDVGREDEALANVRLCPVCRYWELCSAQFTVDRFGGRTGFAGDQTLAARLENFPRIRNHSLLLSKYLAEIRGRDDLLNLSPRQFEEFTSHYIRDVFGCEVVMTKQTRDGGFDLLCFDSDKGPFIVECKHYNRTKVGVELVRQLAGVQLINAVPRSFIVTTGQITGAALRERSRLNSFTDYQMEIRDIHDLLDWLGKKIAGGENTPVCVDFGFVYAGCHRFTYDPVRRSLSVH